MGAHYSFPISRASGARAQLALSSRGDGTNLLLPELGLQNHRKEAGQVEGGVQAEGTARPGVKEGHSRPTEAARGCRLRPDLAGQWPGETQGSLRGTGEPWRFQAGEEHGPF